jgi:hypothetical protein
MTEKFGEGDILYEEVASHASLSESWGKDVECQIADDEKIDLKINIVSHVWKIYEIYDISEIYEIFIEAIFER